jgi:hypothetical protein
MKIFYTIYETTNIETGKIYIGQHQTLNLNDGYLGSGYILKQSIKKYGKEKFTKKILFIFDNRDEMISKEIELVNDAFLSRNDVYNLVKGGLSGRSDHIAIRDSEGNCSLLSKKSAKYLSGNYEAVCEGLVTAKNVVTGKVVKMSIKDERYISGEFVHICTGMTNVIDPKTGRSIKVSVDDERIKTGEIEHINKGMVTVYDSKVGKNIQISKSDTRYTTGQLTSINRDMIITIDPNTNIIHKVSKYDLRYLDGTLIPLSRGKVPVKDPNTEKVYFISNKDEGYLSGELIHINTGMINVKDPKTGKKHFISNKDERYLKGELILLTSGMITVRDPNTNKKLFVSNKDERYLSGELIPFNKGIIWITTWKLRMTKAIEEKELESWLSIGWIKKRCKDFSKYDEWGNKLPNEKYRTCWERYKSGVSRKKISLDTDIPITTLMRRIREFETYERKK